MSYIDSLLGDITLSDSARAVGMALATYTTPVTVDTLVRVAAPGTTRAMLAAALADLQEAGYVTGSRDGYQLNPTAVAE